MSASREHTRGVHRSSRPAPRPRVAGAAQLLAFRLFSIVCLAALIALVAYYPLGPVVLVAALGAYAFLLWRKPEIWLFVVPALLPVLDLSAWTGWFYVREADFLLLATAAVCYWKMAPLASARVISGPRLLLLIVLLVSFAVSAWRGLDGMPPLDLDSFSNYQSPYNSLRVAAGLAWALAVLPLATRTLSQDDDRFRQYLIAGMTAGLVLCTAATAWERLAFPGIMNFSSDYRATAPFSDMNVGGAALDAWVILALPFAAVAALTAQRPVSMAVAASIFLAGTYAMLVTFTRSTYAAYGVVLASVFVFSWYRLRSREPQGVAWVLTFLLVFAVVSYVLMRVFATGGYRTLAAVLGMCAAAFFYGAVNLRIVAAARAALVVVIGFAGMAVLFVWVPKGAYLGYSAALALLLTGLLWFGSGRGAAVGGTIAAASLPLLAAGTLLVAWHWGGASALRDAFLALAVTACLVGFNRYAARPLWSLSRASILPAMIAAIALGLMVPVVSNSYVKGRFTTLDQDFQTRIDHWKDGLNMMDAGWTATLFGMGLGSYPRNYFWRNSQGEIPGIQQYRVEDGNAFLRLGGARYPRGHGQPLSVFQMVSLESGRDYRLSFEARGNKKDALIALAVCDKWLLYSVGCHGSVKGKAPAGAWTHVEKQFNSGTLRNREWFGRRTAQLLMIVDAGGTFVDVDNMALTDSAGRNLIRNGDFTAGPEFWFFTSDYHHLPWHAKNMLLHVYFEQGAVGLLVFVGLYLYALVEFARLARRRDAFASALFGALAGLAVVGVFDSVLDVPRLAFLCYFFMLLALYTPVAPLHDARPPSGGTGRERRPAR